MEPNLEYESERAPVGKLKGQVIPAKTLSPAQLEALLALYTCYYEHVEPGLFYADLQEKQWIILLEEPVDGAIKGFSTILQLDAQVQSRPIKVVFSGDTIIDRSYWGQQELVKTWCSFMGGLKRHYPDTGLYWFLICKGYRTYLYLPLYFHDYYPRYDRPTPPFEQELINQLGYSKYPREFQPESGLIVFDAPHGNLKEDLAVIPERRLKDPAVRFFLERNPHFARGDELVSIAEISEANMKALARRMVSEAVSVQLV